jgi:hypothetical protein
MVTLTKIRIVLYDLSYKMTKMLNIKTWTESVDCSVLYCMTSHLHVDLDEAGGCYLVVKHAKGVEQKMLRVLTNSGLHKTS